MARPRIPVEIARRRGTLEAKQVRRAEAGLRLSPGDIGEPPAHLDEIAKAEWERIRSIIELKPVLNITHRAILEHYCLLYGRFVEDCKGTRHMAASERACFHSITMQLGWTPASMRAVRSCW